MEQKEAVFFKNLDALRLFAFLGVYIQHTLPLPEDVMYNASLIELAKSVLSFYYLGVPFFFTLSSFLITYRLLEEFTNKTQIHLFKFYVKRALRIWPLYFLVLLICFLIIPAVSAITGSAYPTLPSVWPFLLFWSNFYMIDHGVSFIFALIPLWSVSIEEQFYFVWGFVLKKFHKHLYLIILSCFILSIVFCYYYLHGMHQSRTNLKLHSLYAVIDFCSGALLGIACHEKKRIYNFLKFLPTLFYPSVYLLLVVFYVLQTYQVIEIDLVLTAIFYSFCYALILFDQTFNRKRVFEAGAFKSINYLGKISYGLYMLHELIVTLMIKIFHFFPGHASYPMLFLHSLVTLVITIIIAHLSYRYFEKYFLDMKTRVLPQQ